MEPRQPWGWRRLVVLLSQNCKEEAIICAGSQGAAAPDEPRRDKTPALVAHWPRFVSPIEPGTGPDQLIRHNLAAVFHAKMMQRKKKKKKIKMPNRGGGETELKLLVCAFIYWSMNQYGFSCRERPGCHGEWISITSTWSCCAVARSQLIASHRFLRGGWMKGMTAKQYGDITHITHPIHHQLQWPWL